MNESCIIKLINTFTCDNVRYYVYLYYNINVFSLIELNVYTRKVKSIEFDSVHVYQIQMNLLVIYAKQMNIFHMK